MCFILIALKCGLKIVCYALIVEMISEKLYRELKEKMINYNMQDILCQKKYLIKQSHHFNLENLLKIIASEFKSKILKIFRINNNNSHKLSIKIKFRSNLIIHIKTIGAIFLEKETQTQYFKIISIILLGILIFLAEIKTNN